MFTSLFPDFQQPFVVDKYNFGLCIRNKKKKVMNRIDRIVHNSVDKSFTAIRDTSRDTSRCKKLS